MDHPQVGYLYTTSEGSQIESSKNFTALKKQLTLRSCFCYLNYFPLQARPFTPTLGLVNTTPEKFENPALFLRLALPSALIRHENGAFRKRSSVRRNLKTLAKRFSTEIIMWSCDWFFPVIGGKGRGIEWSYQIWKCSQNLVFVRIARKN